MWALFHSSRIVDRQRLCGARAPEYPGTTFTFRGHRRCIAALKNCFDIQLDELPISLKAHSGTRGRLSQAAKSAPFELIRFVAFRF